MRILGIDPGATGAMVLVGQDYKPEVFCFSKMTTFQIFEALNFRINVFAVIERVHTFGRGSGASKHNDFEFGKNYGKALGIIECAGLEYETIDPKTWQFYHKLGGKWAPPGSTPQKEKTARKNAHKAKAQELFPDIKVTLENCDALLIAQYAWEKYFDEKTFASKHKSKR
jgi:hypothetical protein